jgi:hypothetical protein
MDFDAALGFLRVEIDKELRGRLPVPQDYLRAHVTERSGLARVLSDDLSSRLVRHLETIYGTVQGDGHVLKTDFEEWYPPRKGEISFYFWRRLQKYWIDHSVLPVQVINSVDKVTDEILGYLGDPQEKENWARRGLVMGHVQSGKTTNYSALIAKAADAGYRIIVVLAGLTNSLRYQTQIRLDQTFVGRSSLGDSIMSEVYPVANVFKGLEEEGMTVRHPFCGTTQQADFSVTIARGVGATEGNFADPILFVTKKHEAVLRRLADWLRGLRQGSPLEGPMLLIDDEADNASINTEKDPGKTTRINARVRELLACSRRSSYVGYTATPFANIFIDPDTTEDMLKEDLFPRDFIKSLEPPDNYIGAEQLFAEDARLRDICVRFIPDDFHEFLPLKHKAVHRVAELPPSLLNAVRQFVLFRAIRILTGDAERHSSMLVNVSRFNAVQQQVHDEIYRFLSDLKGASDVWAASSSWHKSDQLQKLRDAWEKEYASLVDFTWDEVRYVLKKACAAIEVRLVNMRGGGLDYAKAPETGMHVVAVGGLALARGLTLEGLAISYVLRNVGAADTLLQMGRWFGYRTGYERLCRIHATTDMLEDFQEISNAVEELRADLIRMERMGRSPNDFGLRVRQSPTGIAITAANKMRTAKKLPMALDLSTRHLQAFEIFNKTLINEKHLAAVAGLVADLDSAGHERRSEDQNALVWRAVDVAKVLRFVSQFELPQLEFAMVSDENSLVLDYIRDRASAELSLWDIAIPFKSRASVDTTEVLELPFSVGAGRKCRQRFSGVMRQDDPSVVKITKKNVVADVAETDLVYGEDTEALRTRVREGTAESPELSMEKQYLLARERPLLLVHLVQFRLADENGGSLGLQFPVDQPVVTLSLGFPSTDIPPRTREYAASKRLAEMMQRQRDETETDEELDNES